MRSPAIWILVTVMSAATLHGATGPVITVQPTNETVLGGGPANLYVGATGDPSPAYAWFFKGALVTGQASAYLNISQAQTSHQGIYHAVVSNEAGVVTSDAAELLVVTNAPAILTHPADQTVTLGQFASFSVIATGLPPPRYQWRFNGVDLAGRIGASLNFRAEETNAGDYSVVASNSVGSVTSQVARLTVNAAPTITLQPTNVAVIEGQDTRLISAGFGRQPLLRQWFKGEAAVPGATNDRLSFVQIRHPDAGDYYFVVSNDLGSVTSAVATVSVAKAPRHAGAIDIDYYTGTNNSVSLRAAAFDSRGRVLAIADAGILRFERDGHISRVFEPSGVGSGVNSMAVQRDDSMIIGGTGGWRLARIQPDGQWDTNFLPRFTFYEVRSVALQSDGRIVAAGFVSSDRLSNIALAFDASGALDPSFMSPFYSNSFNGGVRPPEIPVGYPQTLLSGPSDDMTVVDYFSSFRVHSDGSPDTSFARSSVRGRFGVFAPDGSLYIGGTNVFTNAAGLFRPYLARLNSRGQIDPGFEVDPGLIERTIGVGAAAVQLDGRIVAAAMLDGGSNAIVRLLPNGQLDPAFPELGFQGSAQSILIQDDGRIVVAGSVTRVNGYARRGLFRLLGDAPGAPAITRQPEELSLNEGQLGALTAGVSVSAATGFQWHRGTERLVGETNALLRLRRARPGDAGDYWMVASNSLGAVTSAVARVTVAAAPTFPGAVDLGFDADCNGPIYSVAPAENGAFIIGGRFSSVGNQRRYSVARIRADYSLDESFDAGAGAAEEFSIDARVDRVAVAPDGKVYAAGRFTLFNGVPRRHLVRLETNGAVDLSFQPPTSFFFSRVRAVVPLPNGKVLVGGDSSQMTRLNADGSTDDTFRRAAFPSSITPTYDIVVAPDGKIVASAASASVLRFHPDGLLDNSFSTEHLMYYNPFSIHLRSDGGLVIGGRPSPATIAFVNGFLYRLGPDGRKACAIGPCFDLRFGEVNWVSGDACDRILVGGRFTAIPSNSPPHFARLLSPGGAADPEFTVPSLNGAVLTGLPLPDGRILIAGEFTEVAGVPRSRIAVLHGGPFSTPTITSQPAAQVLDEGHALTLSVTAPCAEPAARMQWFFDGVAIRGETNSALRVDNALHRDAGHYTVVISNALGAVTSSTAQVAINLASRAPGGLAVERPSLLPSNGVVRALLALPDGKLLVGGSFSNFLGRTNVGLFRLDAEGRIDPGFAHLGTNVGNLALQSDGKILVVQETAYLQRLWPDGSRDTNFSPQYYGYILTAGQGIRSTNALAVSDAGEIWVTRPRQIWRVHDGRTKNVFGEVHAMAFQPDGKLVVGGAFSSFSTAVGGGIPLTNLARLLPDGATDNSFVPNAGTIYAVAIQPDGRIVAGGQFSSAGARISRGVARFNGDGSVDGTFATSPGVQGTGAVVYAVTLQPDGKIVIGGQFSRYNGQPRNGLARLNADGSLDESFSPGAGISGGASQVTSVAMATDGTLHLGGSFTHFNGVPRLNLAAAYNNPLLHDLAFDADTLSVSFLSQYGVRYVLESRSQDNAPWNTVQSLTGDSSVKVLTDTNSIGAMRFYRLRVE